MHIGAQGCCLFCWRRPDLERCKYAVPAHSLYTNLSIRDSWRLYNLFMKKIFLFLMLTMVSFAFVGCSSDDDDSVGGKNFIENRTEAQSRALSALSGTFKYTHEVGVTTITFKERYEPTRVFTVDEDYATGQTTERIIHGLLTITYYDGTSFDKYYYLNKDVSSILLSNTEKGVRTKADIQLTSESEFKMKDRDAFQWQIFKKE